MLSENDATLHNAPVASAGAHAYKINVQNSQETTHSQKPGASGAQPAQSKRISSPLPPRHNKEQPVTPEKVSEMVLELLPDVRKQAHHKAASCVPVVSPGGTCMDVDELLLLQAALERSNRNLELCHKALRTVLESRDELRREHAQEAARYRAEVKQYTELIEQLRAKQVEETTAMVKTSHAEQTSKRRLAGVRARGGRLQQQVGGIRAELGDLRQAAESMPEVMGAFFADFERVVVEFAAQAQNKAYVEELEARVAEAEARVADMDDVRRKLHNQVQTLRGNIRVMCRVRPLTEAEMAAQASVVVHPDPRGNVLSVINDVSGRQANFEYESVFGPDSSQEDVFEQVEDLVISTLDGFNVCIFAYGQTGSGKTFTMEGTAENRGINHRALRRLFRVIEQRSDEFHVDVTVGMLEIYNEQVYDLLQRSTKSNLMSPMKQTFDIRQGPHGMVVKGATRIDVSTYGEVAALIAQGLATRAMAATSIHDRSSRSHCVLTVKVHSTNRITGSEYTGLAHFVDLAGSENVARSEAAGQRLREAQHINKSLSALGDVFLALSKKKKHVPYRNSKLTHLLSDSLGGNSKTLMVVCVNPTEECQSETLCSLNFANRARTVRLGAATPRKKLREVNRTVLSPS